VPRSAGSTRDPKFWDGAFVEYLYVFDDVASRRETTRSLHAATISPRCINSSCLLAPLNSLILIVGPIVFVHAFIPRPRRNDTELAYEQQRIIMEGRYDEFHKLTSYGRHVEKQYDP
jgi:hypothetical protein